MYPDLDKLMQQPLGGGEFPSHPEIVLEFYAYAIVGYDSSRGYYITPEHGVTRGTWYLYNDGIVRRNANVDCKGPVAFWETEELANTFLNGWRI